jgi:Fis family transcriptional regulator, factor for inversion stimulation protein
MLATLHYDKRVELKSEIALPLRDIVFEHVLQYLKASNPAEENFQNIYLDVIAHVECPLIESVLLLCRGNQSKAAQILGLSRGTLRKKMIFYGLV